MKRQDSKTQTLMTRYVLPLVFGALLVALLLDNRAQAKNDTVQQWMQTKRAEIAARTDGIGGKFFVDKVEVKNVSSDIRFDPRELDDSRISFAATFVPVAPKRELDQDALNASAMMFESTEIKKTDDSTFLVTGTVHMNGRQLRATFPMTIAYSGEQKGQPALTFSGDLTVPVGQMAPDLGLPKFLPIRFAIETVAAP